MILIFYIISIARDFDRQEGKGLGTGGKLFLSVGIRCFSVYTASAWRRLISCKRLASSDSEALSKGWRVLSSTSAFQVPLYAVPSAYTYIPSPCFALSFTAPMYLSPFANTHKELPS